MINAKDATRNAIQYVQDLFSNDKPSNVGLEEIEETSGEWKVTVGFSRPWDYPDAGMFAHPLVPKGRPKRVYKVVTLDDDGKVRSVKNRSVDGEP